MTTTQRTRFLLGVARVSCLLALLLAWAPAWPVDKTLGGGSQALVTSGGGGSAGTVGGGLAAAPDLFTGGLSHAVPIDLPPGRRGIFPPLALAYRSSNGNGFVGVGWDLELGALERSLKGGVSYSADDYVLRGGGAASDLVYIGTDTGVYREYRAKIESDLRRIRKYTAGDGRPYFEVTDRSGTRYLYGQTAASRQDDPADSSRIFRWCLDMVIDVHGNFFTVTYFKDTGEIYPASAAYTGYRAPSSSWNPVTGTPGPAAGDLQPSVSVRIYRDAGLRGDAPRMHTLGFEVRTRYLLKSVEVRAASLLRAYRLVYGTSPVTGRSQLTSVELFGSDATVDATGSIGPGTSLPKTTFGWSGSPGFAAGRNWLSGAFGVPWDGAYSQQFIRAVDVTGDGRTDIVIGPDSGGNWYVLESTGGGFVNRGAWLSGAYGGSWIIDQDGNPAYQPGWDGRPERIRPVDVNADGKVDLLLGPDENGNWYLLESTGTAFIDRGVRLSGFAGGSWSWPENQARVRAMDVNGDAMTDIVVGPDGGGNWYVATSNGSAFVYSGVWLSGFAGAPWDRPENQSRIRPMDVDGDGKTDIVVGPDGSGNWYVARSTGLSFSYAGLWLSGFAAAPWDKPENQGRIRVADLNGDGKADILVGPDGGGNWYVARSTGTSFANDGVWLAGFATPPWDSSVNQARIRVVDVNGDGKGDILLGPDGGGNWVAARSTGSSFVNAGVWMTGFAAAPWDRPENQSRIRLADASGDGLPDVVVGPDVSGNWYVMASRAPFPDLISSATNGIGGSTSVTYLPSTVYPNTQLPFSIQTVSAVTVGDGNGTTATTSYSYSGGYFHFGDREFRGFAYASVMGPALDVAETWFHQGNDMAPWANDPTKAVGFMKGKAYASRRWLRKLTSGGPYQETITTYGGGATAPYFNPPSRVETAVCESASGAVTCARRTLTTFQYDGYGNVAREDRYGDISDTGDDTTAVRYFYYNTSTWILDKMVTEIVYAGAGVANPSVYSRIAHTAYSYDGAPDATACSQLGTALITRGLLTTVTRWLDGGGLPLGGPDTRIAYDAQGNLVCVSDPERRKTQFGYDPTRTFQTSVTNALNHVTRTAYYGVDGEPADTGQYGLVKQVTDPNGNGTGTTYDTFGRTKRVTQPDRTWEESTYALGAVATNSVESLTSWGARRKALLDGLGRPYWEWRKGSATGRYFASVTKYGATGAVSRRSLPYIEAPTSLNPPLDSDPRLRWSRFDYDSAGRPTRTTNPDGTFTETCYRDLEGATVTIDANKHRRREVRDVVGAPRLRVQEYTGKYFTGCTIEEGAPYATTTSLHDRLGRLKSVTDANGNATTLGYDTLGRKTSSSDPDLGAWSYGYTPAGDLWWQQDAKGKRINFQYDELHRLKLRDYPDGVDIQYTYDDPSVLYSKGRLTKIKDPTRSDAQPADGTIAYAEYDKMGRAVRKALVVGGAWFTTSRSFDDAGRPKTTTYPDGALAFYDYDTDGNLCKVSSSTADTGCARTAATYAVFSDYNALAQVRQVDFGNAVTTKYVYYESTSNRLQSIVTTRPAAALPAATLLSVAYTWDDGGNVRTITDSLNANLSQTFVHDDLDRLTYASAGTYGALGYSYDKIGNILTKEGVSYTAYDPVKVHAVRSTSDGRTYNYDENGNMYAETGPTPRGLTYDYDNRPATITANGATTYFFYDFAGGRMMKQGSAGTILYVDKLYECTAGSCTKHIFGGSQRVASVTTTGAATSTRYYHPDHLGSTRLVTDHPPQGQSVTVLESLFYRPFGTIHLDSAAAVSKHKFTGQENDPETGLYFYNARYYNPALARFVSADGMAGFQDPQMLNRYSYVRNNPLALVDPTGHWPNWGKLWRWMTRVEVALPLQFLMPPLGTAALLATRDGRNILAGELFVSTLVVTVATGGASLPLAALNGEIVGGASALSSGGDVLAGVAVGGALGLAAGGIGAAINPSAGTLAVQVGKGAVDGAVTGGMLGGAASFAGGKGSLEAVMRGVALGALSGAVLGAARPLVLGRVATSDADVQAQLSRGPRGVNVANVEVRRGGFIDLFNSEAGFTPSNTIFLGSDASAGIIPHELVHVGQWQRHLYGYWLGYLASSALNVATYPLRGAHPYWDNPYEREAFGFTPP